MPQTRSRTPTTRRGTHRLAPYPDSARRSAVRAKPGIEQEIANASKRARRTPSKSAPKVPSPKTPKPLAAKPSRAPKPAPLPTTRTTRSTTARANNVGKSTDDARKTAPAPRARARNARPADPRKVSSPAGPSSSTAPDDDKLIPEDSISNVGERIRTPEPPSAGSRGIQLGGVDTYVDVPAGSKRPVTTNRANPPHTASTRPNTIPRPKARGAARPIDAYISRLRTIDAQLEALSAMQKERRTLVFLLAQEGYVIPSDDTVVGETDDDGAES